MKLLVRMNGILFLSPAAATQRISNQSASPANQRTVNQSPTAATQCTSNWSSAPSTQRAADQSPAVVVTRPNPDQSSKFTPPLTITLPKNTKERKQGSMFKDKAKKRKVNAMRTTQPNPMKKKQKKSSVPQHEDKPKTRKTNTTEEWKRKDKEKPLTKKEYTLEAEVLVDLDYGLT